MVETGDTLGAQKLIMAEVESQVGGVAAATATMGDRAKVAWSNFKEGLGEALIPYLEQLSGWFVTKGIPLLQQFADWVTTKALPALRDLAGWIQTNVIPVVQQFAGWVRNSLIPALRDLGDWISTNVIPKVRSFVTWFRDELWPALQRGYREVVPALKKAWQDLTGAVGNSDIKWREIGRLITGTFIPIATKVATGLHPDDGASSSRSSPVSSGSCGRRSSPGGTSSSAWCRRSSTVSRPSRPASPRSSAACRRSPGSGGRRTPPRRWSSAAAAARRLAANLGQIRSRTVNVHVRFSSSGRSVLANGGRSLVGGLTRHGGGPVHKGSTYLVGEHGPELLTAGQTGHITPTRQTQAMLRSDPRNGWGQGNHDDRPQIIQLVVDGRVLQEVLLKRKKSTGMALGLA